MTVRLIDFAADVTSQFGEDGIIAEILRRLEIEQGWCVEFGAWDGKLMSNTWTLWAERGWSAVLIEGDEVKANELIASTGDNPAVTAVHALVEIDGPSSLDSLLARTPIPEAFEVLSIDIDGDDHRIWESLTRYSARIVVIEHNASFPPHIEFVQRPGAFTGSSARALEVLGERKGYEPVEMTWANVIFLRTDDRVALGLPKRTVTDLFDPWALPVVYSDYAGHHHVLKPSPWGYLGASRDGADSAASMLREVAAVGRWQSARRWPGLGATRRRISGLLKRG